MSSGQIFLVFFIQGRNSTPYWLYCAASVHRKDVQNFGPPLKNAPGFKNYVKKDILKTMFFLPI